MQLFPFFSHTIMDENAPSMLITGTIDNDGGQDAENQAAKGANKHKLIVNDTPIRPLSLIASPASSASSSSTISSVFDEEENGAGTPSTPPSFEGLYDQPEKNGKTTDKNSAPSLFTTRLRAPQQASTLEQLEECDQLPQHLDPSDDVAINRHSEQLDESPLPPRRAYKPKLMDDIKTDISNIAAKFEESVPDEASTSSNQIVTIEDTGSHPVEPLAQETLSPTSHYSTGKSDGDEHNSLGPSLPAVKVEGEKLNARSRNSRALGVSSPDSTLTTRVLRSTTRKAALNLSSRFEEMAKSMASANSMVERSSTNCGSAATVEPKQSLAGCSSSEPASLSNERNKPPSEPEVSIDASVALTKAVTEPQRGRKTTKASLKSAVEPGLTTLVNELQPVSTHGGEPLSTTQHEQENNAHIHSAVGSSNDSNELLDQEPNAISSATSIYPITIPEFKAFGDRVLPKHALQVRIIEKISKYPTSKVKPVDGYIYIFKSELCPGYIKIGMTKQLPESRVKQWTNKCKFSCIHIGGPHDMRFLHCGLVESILKEDLYNERRKFTCKVCKSQKGHRYEYTDSENPRAIGTEHGEWYEISEARALEVVNTWCTWMARRQPYRQQRAMREFWDWKTRRARMEVDVDWTKWTKVSRVDFLQFGLHCIDKKLEASAPAIVRMATDTQTFFTLALMVYFLGFRNVMQAIVASVVALLVTVEFRFLYC